MIKEKVLIAGANGSTGRLIINELKESRLYQPIAMVRKQDQENYFEQQNVSCVIGDLEEDVSHVVKDIDKVIFAAGSGGKNVVGVDQEGAKKLIDKSEEKKVSKFVMLSSMGADDPSVSDDLEDYLKAKQNADQYLKESNLIYTIVRPGSLTNADGTGKIKYNQKLNKFGEISREDVAKTLVNVLEKDTEKNKTFEILEGETPITKALN